jgi:hypothetical protein
MVTTYLNSLPSPFSDSFQKKNLIDEQAKTYRILVTDFLFVKLELYYLYFTGVDFPTL